MSTESKRITKSEGESVELPEWDDTGESLLRYEWLKIRYDGP